MTLPYYVKCAKCGKDAIAVPFRMHGEAMCVCPCSAPAQVVSDIQELINKLPDSTLICQTVKITSNESIVAPTQA